MIVTMAVVIPSPSTLTRVPISIPLITRIEPDCC